MTKARILAFAVVTALAMTTAVKADELGNNVPIAGAQTTPGSLAVSDVAPVAPAPKSVDGDISDWTGSPTRLGGTAIYTHGEYVYQDFLGDAWGADDGFDANRLQTLDQAETVAPRTYRVDALQQAAGDQFGAPQPVGAQLHYGDADLSIGDAIRTQADIEEVRVAADADNLYFLVRTLNMQPAESTAVEVLLDTEAGPATYATAGGVTTKAEWALVFSAHKLLNAFYKGAAVAIACELPCTNPVSVAADAGGYTNAIEISVDRSTFGDPSGIGVGTGVVDDVTNPTGLAHVAAGDAKSDLINVAFRHEPVRIWMDKAQGLALRDGSIDQFITPVDLDRLTGGSTQTFTQRPGYYEAIYEDTTSPVNREQMDNSYFQGTFQHYGVYLPQAYRDGHTYGSTFWMHYRGGHAHDAASWEPSILREFGDDPGMIVVTPSARGTSSWYTGRGMVDFLDVWKDSHERWNIDGDRTYLAGHSMGGWASWLLGLLMPDKWAASNPEDGLLVPGLWTGFTDPSDPQNGGDVQAEFLAKIITNASNLPYAILHGTEDELVPVSSAISAAKTLNDLGYKYRLYTFHAYEHYSAPIWDDWRDIVAYMTQFHRDADPAHVSYKVWPALDHAVSTISAPAGVDLGLKFDGAYWVSDMKTRDDSNLDPANIGSIDATSSGIAAPVAVNVPEAGTGAQPEPYTMVGQRSIVTGFTPTSNAFSATLTNLSAATLDLKRMSIGTGSPITATVTTDGECDLVLKGPWSDGLSRTLHFAAAGVHQVTLTP